ncbi:MAG: hypothetical protein DMG47_09420 [Acidobacteria bacterium]|nr:MAG: hypothetical protein DMG47_09420 [Acidobacteriota bacterium]
MLRRAGKSGSMLGHSVRGESMRKQYAFLAAGFLTVGLMAALGSAQMDKASKPSPAAKASCALADGKTITVDYSSPRAKGRKIFGGLVPYGEVWRAGANEATTFVTTADLMVGGTHVPAGKYTIFAIPNKDKWTLVISKKTGEWGIPYPGASEDLSRIDMKASTLPSTVENFTIAFDKTGSGCTLRMDWETTRASVDISKM